MIFRKKARFALIILFLTNSFNTLISVHAGSAHSNSPPSTIKIKILGINDFHGQISTGRLIKNEPVGGAAILAAYLKQSQSGMENNTIITIMGDQTGASPPSSGLLHDEPSILFTNSLGNRHCSPQNRMNPLCNIVATIGNHEFDRGQKAMFDLIYGTNAPPKDEWINLPFYPGASYPYISANIVSTNTGKLLFPPYTIKLVNNIPVAFIGAVLKNAADSMFPANAKGIKFLPEAEAINHYIPEIKAQGAQIIIVLIHEGGTQEPYQGDTKENLTISGAIKNIVTNLDDDIDVVMGGHTHQFLNAYVPNRNGVNMLVTQANSYSAAFTEVTLKVDSQTHKVRRKSARIITTYANRWPGTVPDESAQQIVKLAEDKVEPIINSYVGTLQNTLLRKQNEDGESNLSNLITDAYRAAMNTDIAFTNATGIRDDLSAGIITWGKIYSVLPFANKIVSISLTGQDIYDLLEQQWMGSYIHILPVSGLSYVYDDKKPTGKKIISITYNNKPLLKNRTYTIATNDFLASGHGVFSVMKRGKLMSVGKNDHDVVTEYIRQLPQPFSAEIEGRINNSNHKTKFYIEKTS